MSLLNVSRSGSDGWVVQQDQSIAPAGPQIGLSIPWHGQKDQAAGDVGFSAQLITTARKYHMQVFYTPKATQCCIPFSRMHFVPRKKEFHFQEFLLK